MTLHPPGKLIGIQCCPVNVYIERPNPPVIGTMSLSITCCNKKKNQAMVHCNTILSQVLRFVPRREFEMLANRHHSGRAFRTASRWSQVVTMAMTQMSGRSIGRIKGVFSGVDVN